LFWIHWINGILRRVDDAADTVLPAYRMTFHLPEAVERDADKSPAGVFCGVKTPDDPYEGCTYRRGRRGHRCAYNSVPVIPAEDFGLINEIDGVGVPVAPWYMGTEWPSPELPLLIRYQRQFWHEIRFWLHETGRGQTVDEMENVFQYDLDHDPCIFRFQPRVMARFDCMFRPRLERSFWLRNLQEFHEHHGQVGADEFGWAEAWACRILEEAEAVLGAPTPREAVEYSPDEERLSTALKAWETKDCRNEIEALDRLFHLLEAGRIPIGNCFHRTVFFLLFRLQDGLGGIA